jgi:hypothetical protein
MTARQSNLRLISGNSRQFKGRQAEVGNPCRVTFDGAHFGTVRLEPAFQEPGTDMPAMLKYPSRSFIGVLLNIGSEGIGIKVSDHVASRLFASVRCRCAFNLPSLPEPMDLSGRVTHGRPMGDGSFYIGLAFEFESCPLQRKWGGRISRFTDWYEKQQSRPEWKKGWR